MSPFVRLVLILLAVATPLPAQFHLPGSGSSNGTDAAPAPKPAPATKGTATGKATTPASTVPAPRPRFDFYVFALSPTPSGQGVRFLVEGLRPQAGEGAGAESCGPVKKPSKAAISIVLPLMKSADAVRQEWQVHGSCTGLSAADYFTDIRHARALVQIPVQLTSLDGPVTLTPEQIEDQFAGANPTFPQGAFRTGCARGVLTEVRICFDALMKPRTCTAAVEECPARELAIRPPL
jgi:ribonuclease T2